MRIAQIVFAPVTRVETEERGLAGSTERGSGGFGSTGTA
jgi:dUTP pyrophosphatase